VPEADNVRVLGVGRRERGQEGGGLADGALPFVVRQKFERLALGFGHALRSMAGIRIIIFVDFRQFSAQKIGVF
jgi:hypothetical protein